MSSVVIVKPNRGERQDGTSRFTMVSKNGLDPMSNAGTEMSSGSACSGAPNCVRCRCMMLGGICSMGQPFMPSSKRHVLQFSHVMSRDHTKGCSWWCEARIQERFPCGNLVGVWRVDDLVGGPRPYSQKCGSVWSRRWHRWLRLGGQHPGRGTAGSCRLAANDEMHMAQ